MSDDFKIVRWREWDCPGIEHLEIDRDGLVVTYPDFWQRG